MHRREIIFVSINDSSTTASFCSIAKSQFCIFVRIMSLSFLMPSFVNSDVFEFSYACCCYRRFRESEWRTAHEDEDESNSLYMISLNIITIPFDCFDLFITSDRWGWWLVEHRGIWRKCLGMKNESLLLIFVSAR